MPSTPFEDDLTCFFDKTEFATTATTLNGISIAGIFNSPYAKRELGPAVINSQHYELLCTSRELCPSHIQVSTCLQIDGAHYTVIRLEPDGTGVTTLILEPLKPMETLADDDFNY